MAASCTLRVAVIVLLNLYSAKSQEECASGGCYPATGDLLVGREQRLTASSTCGLNGETEYCIVSFLTGKSSDKCFICDSRREVDERGAANSHLPKYMVTRKPERRLQTWWQAENGLQSVQIQLDLEAEFVFTHLIMTFKTFRPKAMYIERSFNYGRTWSVYRYFAENCAESYPQISRGPQENIDDVICEERFSKIEPSTQGEVVMKVLDPLIQKREDPYSERVQKLLKLTNLRIKFERLHTLGDDVIGDSPDVNKKYYYALYEMVVRGSCSCYGHAEQCIPFEGAPTDVDMVHGKCNCTHNTQGRNCEKCKDGYNDQPWRPAYRNQINVCKKCNCNNHSNKCHFDLAVYNATNGVSGGVCDDCQHSTTGRQCEQCKPLYFRDPFKNIFDPDVCKPCDCDPSGSFGGGECETVTDPGRASQSGEIGTVAGRCICKRNVGGRRCDTCKDGFWNLLESNPDGCQSCNCDPKGTVVKDKCIQESGICRCKRFVTGATCSKCVERYWNLGSTPEGCEPCKCDVGGSYNDVCDDITGSCSCRPNIVGRQCNEVRPGYYFNVFDQNVYEGEDTVPIKGDHQKVMRIHKEGSLKTWTGDGFVRVVEGSEIQFPMVRVPSSGDYQIVIRYEPQGSGDWNDVRVRISRADGGTMGGGPCPETDEREVYFFPRLTGDKTAVIVDNTICLLKNVQYKMEIDFQRHSGDGQGVALIDSIVLMPVVDKLNVFRGRDGDLRKETFDKLKCQTYYKDAGKASKAPEECKKFQFSISAELNDGASQCQCDPVGTKSTGSSDILSCEAAGGQCPCKPGVVGRRCNRCAAGYFGFGQDGCKACDCSDTGSKSLFCDEIDGQCSCKDILVGRKCDSCPPNHYGFPNCLPCKCTGHSDTCNPTTGVCTNCLHNTAGPRCDRCADGYYGDATRGTPNDCQRCQCPGGSGGNQFAETCKPDSNGNIICIDCLPGYFGQQCQKCDDGYYGNPIVSGGTCKKCDCNGNIDPFAVGKCDAVNGNCFNCQFNTAGDNCEKCMPGFYGNARNRTCGACTCNYDGTDPSKNGICDAETGQCPCLKNVEGKNCDRCKRGFFNHASGKGCESCNCDKDGSLVSHCNQLDGQCHCRVGFGGRDCSECEDFSWGNPKSQDGCKACKCNIAGSVSAQCNRTTGVCQCKDNIVGKNCDMCAPRTSGMMPKCEDCHPCNDDWQDIVTELEKNVTRLISMGGINITVDASSIKAYVKEIQALKDRLAEVEEMLKNTSLSAEEVNKLREQVVEFRKQIIEIDQEAEPLIKNVAETQKNVDDTNKQLDGFDLRYSKLKKELDDLASNISKIILSDIGGALDSIRESDKKSQDAFVKADTSAELKAAKKDIRKIKKEVLKPKKDTSFEDLNNENLKKIAELKEKIAALTAEIKRLNEMLCGKQGDAEGDFGDSVCGGCVAGDLACTVCGNNAKCEGGRMKAEQSMEKAEEANKAILEKKAKVEAVRDEMKRLEDLLAALKQKTQDASDQTDNAKAIGEGARQNITQLLKDIYEFLNSTIPDNDETRRIAEETLRLNITLTPDQIQKLAQEIKEVLKKIDGVDEILKESQKDYDEAKKLQSDALVTKEKAEKLMRDADLVISNLTSAENMQKSTRQAIEDANKDIQSAISLHDKIKKMLEDLKKKLDDASKEANQVETEQKQVQAAFEENKKNLDSAEGVANDASTKAEQLKKDAAKLQDDMTKTEADIDKKAQLYDDMKRRVATLTSDTVNLFGSADDKLTQLDNLQKEFITNKIEVDNLLAELNKLRVRAAFARDKLKLVSECHRDCNPQAQAEAFCRPQLQQLLDKEKAAIEAFDS